MINIFEKKFHINDNKENKTKKDKEIKKYLTYLIIIFYGLFIPKDFRKDIQDQILFLIFSIILIIIYEKYSNLEDFFKYLYLILSITFPILQIHYCIVPTGNSLRIHLYGTVEGPWRYRILIPLLVRLLILVFWHVSYLSFDYLFRYFFLALIFLTTSILIEMINNEFLSEKKNQKIEIHQWIPLLYLIIFPFSWQYLMVTDFPEIVFATLFLIFILKKKYFKGTIIYVLALLNRDSIIFYIAFFAIYYLFEDIRRIEKFKTIITKCKLNLVKNFKLFFYLIFLGALHILIKIILILVLGPTYLIVYKWEDNSYILSELIQDFLFLTNHDYKFVMIKFVIFMGGLFILIYVSIEKNPLQFSISSLVLYIIYFIFYLFYANIYETRVLYILLPAIMINFNYIILYKRKIT